MGKNYSDYLIRSVESRDIPNIRGALLGIIDKDPKNIDIAELESALRYALQSVRAEELFEKDDPGFDDPDSANDYYYALSSLKQNFSREKLNKVKALGGKKSSNPVTGQGSNLNSNNRSRQHVQNGSRAGTVKTENKRRESAGRSFRVGTAVKVGMAVLIVLAVVIVIIMRMK